MKIRVWRFERPGWGRWFWSDGQYDYGYVIGDRDAAGRRSYNAFPETKSLRRFKLLREAKAYVEKNRKKTRRRRRA